MTKTFGSKEEGKHVEDGNNEYEADGLIVDDADEGGKERPKKSKKKKRLIEDNITGFCHLDQERQKFKPLRKANGDTGQGHSRAFGSGTSRRTAEELGDHKKQIFEDITKEDRRKEVEEDDDSEEDDEMADVIVNEEAGDEQGGASRQKKANKKNPFREAYEIFGNVKKALRQRKEVSEKMNDSSKETKLEHDIEPMVLADKYLREKVRQIHERDIPERIQMSEQSTGPPPTDNASLIEETHWIYNRFVSDETEIVINKEDIMRLLELMHVQKYDVPFVAKCFKDKCLTLFQRSKDEKQHTAQWHKVLWAIHGLDRKWLLLQKRKTAFQSYYKKWYEEELSRTNDNYRTRFNQKLFESITKSVKSAESEREVANVILKANLQFPPLESGAGEKAFKFPQRQSLYSICNDNGLQELASKFGYSSEQFGFQLSLEKMGTDKWEDIQKNPEDVAIILETKMFENPEDKLKGARHMMWYISSACTQQKKLVANQLCYLIDGVSKYDQLWNEQRKMILGEAFFGFLFPSMERECIIWLRNKAKSWLIHNYGKLLWDKVMITTPFQQGKDKIPPRVMACCWGSPTTIVMLNRFGEVLDTLEARYISTQNGVYQQLKKDDETRLKEFITTHHPHLMVVGAENLHCTRLRKDITEIFFNIVEFFNPETLTHATENFKVVFGDDCIPRIFENSNISSQQLSSHSGIVKRAVALGRYIQNPIAMIAALCGPEREILAWKLSPLEDHLTDDEKYGMVDQIMVDITNQVGLDFNLASAHEWMCTPLHFISGLGPIKEAFLMRSLSDFKMKKEKSISNTSEVFMVAHHLGGKVYANAVNFLCGDSEECRREFREPNKDEEFEIRTWETDDTLAKGRSVLVTVQIVYLKKVICRLEPSGLCGILMRKDCTVGSEKLQIGDTLSCWIKSVEKEKYLVYLSCNKTEMRAIQVLKNQESRDTFYHEPFHYDIDDSLDNVLTRTSRPLSPTSGSSKSYHAKIFPDRKCH